MISCFGDVSDVPSHQLLKQITELEGGGGGHKGGGASGGGKGGAVDGKLREKLTLFRLTTDAMVKVCAWEYNVHVYTVHTCTSCHVHVSA